MVLFITPNASCVWLATLPSRFGDYFIMVLLNCVVILYFFSSFCTQVGLLMVLLTSFNVCTFLLFYHYCCLNVLIYLPFLESLIFLSSIWFLLLAKLPTEVFISLIVNFISKIYFDYFSVFLNLFIAFFHILNWTLSFICLCSLWSNSGVWLCPFP